MRLSVALIACAFAGGALFAGLRFSSAVGQMSAIAIPDVAEGGLGADRAGSDFGGYVVDQEPAAGSLHTDPAFAVSAAVVGVSTDNGAPPDTADEIPAPAVDERELLLEYFGPDVSLNDLGQLAIPDPEFERAIRERANEIGEIPAAP